MVILPLSYLPSVEWFAWLKQGNAVIDMGEHYIKRSERNRARILAPNGVMDLTVQVAHANRPRQPMRDMLIDYSKRWQHQHWGAFVSAYKGSPYFEYYADLFEPFYRKEWKFLVDYNLRLIEILCREAALPMPSLSSDYIVAGEEDIDLRPKIKKGSTFVAEPYIQVFSDRMDFIPNLSFVDLFFAEGPSSASVLDACL